MSLIDKIAFVLAIIGAITFFARNMWVTVFAKKDEPRSNAQVMHYCTWYGLVLMCSAGLAAIPGLIVKVGLSGIIGACIAFVIYQVRFKNKELSSSTKDGGGNTHAEYSAS